MAFFAVGSPVGQHGDWAARVAMNSGDVSSWTMAGDYTTRATARHRLTLGMTYSLQRYEGGTFSPLQAVPDGHRKVAAIAARHDVALTQRWSIGYGARYEHYDYLDGYGLVSPSVKAVFTPVPELRFHAGPRSSRSLRAPRSSCRRLMRSGCRRSGRSRRSATAGSRPRACCSTELGATRQLRGLSIGVRGFRQAIDDQQVTVFGVADPVRLIAAGGHYSVAVAGDARLHGWGVRVEHALSPYVRGSVDYALVETDWDQPSPANIRALAAVAPRALRQADERLHDLTTSIEARDSRTSTRFLALYKLNSGFAGDPHVLQSADARFDMQLRQGLPFINGAGDWEMLVGVRSLFRTSFDDRSFYDELLVVRPPKRVMGGLQVRF